MTAVWCYDDGDDDDDGDDGDDGGDSDEDFDGDPDDEFGDDGDEEDTLEEILEKIKNAQLGTNSEEALQTLNDKRAVLNALGVLESEVKRTFRTKGLAKNSIGIDDIFPTNSDTRVDNVLNEIFK